MFKSNEKQNGSLFANGGHNYTLTPQVLQFNLKSIRS